ncbi:MAG TPA: tetratricopeptide repeat protein, partial [Vicinamibacterales bacterium]|nr:tetratricopeptide repeat protein [Vicinamibacterales bacterium]
MPETREHRIVSDAEQAAAAGDYDTAERLLRETARQLEEDLGPLHPELANTLNNLGVVCERANRPTEAELFYRRAFAIASE